MWPEPAETEGLLDDARRGAPHAVDQLLDRYREALRGMVRSRMDRALGRRIDASDIVQDVLLEASQRLKDYLRDPKVPFKIWLRQMAQDRIIDTHRRHRVAARRSMDRERPLSPGVFSDQSSLDLAAQLRDRELTPAAAAIRQELQRRFAAALETMDEEDREILLMRHFEQLTNSEAAEMLGVSPPAAGMRHLRALRKLRLILGDSPSQV